MIEYNKFPDKPFKEFDELIKILKKRNINIPVNKVDFAKHALVQFSYYDLVNGYKDVFSTNDLFRNNLTMDYLYKFSHFDHSFQNILFQYSLYLENNLKTVLAYVISKDFGVFEEDYLSSNNFIKPRDSKSSKSKRKTISDIKNVYNKNIKYINEPTKHYKMTKNHIPPWILFKNISFSTSINLYSILKKEQKDQVLDLMLTDNLLNDYKYEIFKASLSITKNARNTIVHNLNYINFNDDTYKLSKKYFKNTPYEVFFEKKLYSNVYSHIIALTATINDNYLIDQMFSTLKSVVELLGKGMSGYEIFVDYARITGIPENLFYKYDEFTSKTCI